MPLASKPMPSGARPGSEALATSYLDIFRATPVDRIEMIKKGIGAAAAKRMFADLAVPQGQAFAMLKLSPATVNRKAMRGETLSPEESERVIGMAKLIGQLQAMLEDSGYVGGFDAAHWIARWLQEPLPAFGGTRPFDLLDTMEGQALVAAALAQVQSGAYA